MSSRNYLTGEEWTVGMMLDLDMEEVVHGRTKSVRKRVRPI